MDLKDFSPQATERKKKHELPRIIHEWLAQQLHDELHGNYMLKEKN